MTKKTVLDAEQLFFAEAGWARRDIKALDALFSAYPKNTCSWQVLLKVTALNALYKTRIMNVYPVVETILGIGRKLDSLISRGDPAAVDLMKMVKFEKRDKTIQLLFVRVQVLPLPQTEQIPHLRSVCRCGVEKAASGQATVIWN